MKFETETNAGACLLRRTPQGVRGLKCGYVENGIVYLSSHPVRGAWIEIKGGQSAQTTPPSHPVRGAWIEMPALRPLLTSRRVAPRKGCVD